MGQNQNEDDTKDEMTEEEVKDKSTIGYHTRDEAVHCAHIDHQYDERYDERDDTLLDRLLTE